MPETIPNNVKMQQMIDNLPFQMLSLKSVHNAYAQER
jgi:hypothetical protein